MDDKTFLNEIKLRRDLHGVIKNLVILATKVFRLESDLNEIKNHLGLNNEKRLEKETETV